MAELAAEASLGGSCFTRILRLDFLRQGGGIYDLLKILGHSTIRTTELYLDHLAPEQQKVAKYGRTK